VRAGRQKPVARGRLIGAGRVVAVSPKGGLYRRPKPQRMGIARAGNLHALGGGVAGLCSRSNPCRRTVGQ
jgi:hypothetical protein